MHRYLPVFFLVALIPGCGVVCDLLGLPGDCLSSPRKETGSPELKAFESEEELAEYLSEQITARNERFADLGVRALEEQSPDAALTGDGAADGPEGTIEAPTDAGTTVGADGDLSDVDFSQTTIQEKGVDEADVVKTDGTHLYIIHNTSDGALLRIVRVSPPEQLGEADGLPLEGFAREIYLHDSKVVALTETHGVFAYPGGPGILVDPLPVTAEVVDSGITDDSEGGAGEADGAESGLAEPGLAPEIQYERPSTIVTVVDVSVPDTPTMLSQTEFDGSLSSSRMIDGVLHLVVSNFQDYYYDVLPLLGQPELDVSNLDAAELLPKYRRIDGDGEESEGNVVTWRELYHPTDPDGFGVVTVVSLDVDNDAAFTAVGVVAEPGLIYSSLDALYLTDTEFTFLLDLRETTDIYKFAYAGRGAVPVATGSVPGRILNQYSMSEYQGYLRVATTVGAREPHNNVYVLSQTGATLETVGRLENVAPGETITSARFIRDRGYLVTFRRIDPLHTLDLSDPTAPKVVGELEVPGFSTFIIPMDADHLLTVGQHIPEDPVGAWGVKLSIFDVSDFANPRLMAEVVPGEGAGAYSEALGNPKAFTDFLRRGLVALPVSIYDDLPVIVDPVPVAEPVDESGETEASPDEAELFVPQGFDGIVVYSVSVEDGFTELGRISTRFEEAGIFWSSFTRGVFISDDVFAVTEHGVRGAPLDDIGSVPYELIFK